MENYSSKHSSMLVTRFRGRRKWERWRWDVGRGWILCGWRTRWSERGLCIGKCGATPNAGGSETRIIVSLNTNFRGNTILMLFGERWPWSFFTKKSYPLRLVVCKTWFYLFISIQFPGALGRNTPRKLTGCIIFSCRSQWQLEEVVATQQSR